MPTWTDPKKPPRVAAEASAGLVVLVAENDDALRAYMVEVLTEVGNWVVSARNGKEAVSVLRLRHVDLFVIDLTMPEQEGLETILFVRKHFPNLKLIAMSGFLNAHLQAARSLGARAVLHKPFSASDLVTILQCVCQRGLQPGCGRPGTERDPSSEDPMTQSQRKFAGANQSLGQPEAAKGEIDTQNGKLSKIIKAMDEIAFEAKILAVNSALLAARAGESGIGFGVVVDEMRNLSRRCAQAANDASALIEKPVARSYDGRATVGQAAAGLRTKTAESTEVITRVDEASLGNEVQNHGGEQMEPVAQQTAANAAERSAAAGALIAQWETLIDIVENSTTAVSGGESAWDGARHSARDRGGLVAQSAGASGKSSTHAKAFLPAGASSAANAFPPEDEFKELRN